MTVGGNRLAVMKIAPRFLLLHSSRAYYARSGTPGSSTLLVMTFKGLPQSGVPAAELFAQVKGLHANDPYEREDGKVWGGVYHDHSNQPDLADLQADVWREYNATNALYPASWPSLRKYESEVVQMVVDLLGGGAHEQATGSELQRGQTCGLLSSGGTESILIAAIAYRELANQRGIERPEIICSSSAHGAIHKACHYFGMDLIMVPFQYDEVQGVTDISTLQLGAEQVRSRITKNTIAIYASAPTFPHGVIDNIPALGQLALEHSIGLHVDNCLGGILLSFLKKNGKLGNVEFDFDVPGVSTMSVVSHAEQMI